MTITNGICVIICDDMGSSKYYLIMERNTSWKGWEFPKGILRPGESEEDTVNRVVSEKTGIKKYKVMGKIPAYKEFENAGQITHYNFYLVEANMNTPVTHGEKHSTYHWATKERVLEKLTYDADKKALLISSQK